MAKERGILFSAPMVRALLAGIKSQTRRRTKWDTTGVPDDDLVYQPHRCPYGVPGDRLYVKEAAWMWCERRPNGVTKTGRPKWLYVPLQSATVLFASEHPSRPGTSVVSPDTGNTWAWRMKVGRFLPKWASRITLEVTEVRVQRLQDITEEEAKAEGLTVTRTEPEIRYASSPDNPGEWRDPREAFRCLWDYINGKKAPWSSNPWLWVVGFRRLP